MSGKKDCVSQYSRRELGRLALAVVQGLLIVSAFQVQRARRSPLPLAGQGA